MVSYHIQLSGEGTLCVYFDFEAEEQSLLTNINAGASRVHFIKAVAAHLREALVLPLQTQHPDIAAYWDVIPANHNITLVYNPFITSFSSAKTALKACLDTFLSNNNALNPPTSNMVQIPVFYGGEFALDLKSVSDSCGMSISEVIECHTAGEYEVAAVGFAPGFAYLNGLKKPLQLPRMTVPRKWIKGGSVAIAEGQTAVYPGDSPAGWHVIGHCPIPMFSLEEGARLSMGDRVKFTRISLEEYQSYGVL